MTPEAIDKYRSLDPEEFPVAMGYQDGKFDNKRSRNPPGRRIINLISHPINQLIIKQYEGYDDTDWQNYQIGYIAATFEAEIRARRRNQKELAAFLKRRIAATS
jgi:hypothetical protein